MGTKLKSYSHSILTKIVVFIIAVICFTGALKAFVDVVILRDADFRIVSEEDYFHSRSFVQENENVISNLTRLLGEYKSEEHILNGGTITEDEIRNEESNLYGNFQSDSRSYNPELSEAQNYEKFKEEYAAQISQARDRLIHNDLKEYHLILQNLEENGEPLYYASDGVNVYKNSSKVEKLQFKTHPSYMIFEGYKREFYPKEMQDNERLYMITEGMDGLNPQSHVIYIAFTEKYLDGKIKEWQKDKEVATNSLYRLIGFLAGLILSFIYLIIVIGKRSFKDQEIHLHVVDKLYNDINIVLCFFLIALWFATMDVVGFQNIHSMAIPITIPIASVGLVFVLSLVKHIKNRTFFKHTFIFTILYKLFDFVRNVYESGSIGIKTVLIVIGYPVLIAITFFMFPVTIGVAAWFAYKKVKSFNAIKEGVERIKDGDIHHRIEVDGKGEFSKLAADINSITDGLKKAVDSELKSERMKTELITNVSHDIRTPLTSIITYVDLLKNEKDLSIIEDYVEVLDQKSKRLKVLTDDLFEAAKATSGNIPVNVERIDIVSLLTQGLGEVSDKIEALELNFKVQHPKEKVYITADGRLLWRSIENLLSNIFKYAQSGSRVYIDIEDLGNEILVTFKNISAYELNISADELMERFKRGDESRSSQGSGLGLSIAKSLIELQKGTFTIQVDGDLFKAVITMPKHKNID